MATSTELLRAAEHMRQQSDAAFREANNTILNRNLVIRATSLSKAADALEAEAARLRFDEEASRRYRRSWPEGWPPFAVLRRAYELLGRHHSTSVFRLERAGTALRSEVAAAIRTRWAKCLQAAVQEKG